MKRPFGISVFLVAILALFGPSRAFAGGPVDGGMDGDTTVEGGAPSDEAGSPPIADDASGDGPATSGTSAGSALACDGALCSTVTGGTTCAIAVGLGSSRAAHLSISAALLLGAMGIGTLRRCANRAKGRRR
jgi:hypothetical protein